MNMNLVLVYFAKKYEGDWEKMYQAIAQKERIDFKDLEKLDSDMNCKYITIIDNNYPNHFKSKYKPPFVLFYNGVEPTDENTQHLDGGVGAYVLDLA